MSKKIKVTGDGACLFNGLAIGLANEILQGRLDSKKDSLGYRQLLDAFAKQHKNFQPKTWDNLKHWLRHYNHARDIEVIFAPVLFQLNKQHQNQNKKKLNTEISKELTNLLINNEFIQGGLQWFQIKSTNEYGGIAPRIDNLDFKLRNELVKKWPAILNEYKSKYKGNKAEGGLDENNHFDSKKLEVVRKKLTSFIQEKYQHVVTELTNAMGSQENDYQRGYSCGDIMEMTNSLDLNLIENDQANAPSKIHKIDLKNKDAHWDVVVDDDSAVHLSAKKLEITTHQSFNGKTVVASPPQLSNQNIPQPNRIERENNKEKREHYSPKENSNVKIKPKKTDHLRSQQKPSVEKIDRPVSVPMRKTIEISNKEVSSTAKMIQSFPPSPSETNIYQDFEKLVRVRKDLYDSFSKIEKLLLQQLRIHLGDVQSKDRALLTKFANLNDKQTSDFMKNTSFTDEEKFVIYQMQDLIYSGDKQHYELDFKQEYIDYKETKNAKNQDKMIMEDDEDLTSYLKFDN